MITAQQVQTVPEVIPEPTPRPVVSYEAFLKSVKTSEKSVAKLFTYLDSDMPEYWDDTTWDFNGVSRTPGEGDIACGYFVTTLLKDLGIKLDRIRLAQAPSATMIKELTVDIKTRSSVSKMLDEINAGPKNAIYIVGLDFHTGFISHSDEGTFFIHSSYINREGVVREPAASSEALHHSGFFMFGNLTASKSVINSWAN